MADTGVKATGFLLDDLKRRVRRPRDRAARRQGLLIDAIAELLAPLERNSRSAARRRP